jgi:serine/threonine protein kinase
MKVLLRNGTRSVRAELGRELGKGAAGRIHEVVGRPDLVAKVYVDPATRAPSPRLARVRYDRIDAMLRNPPKVGEPHQEGGRSFHQLAWPTDHVLTTSGEALGFAMPMLPLKHACDLEAILTRRSREREGLPHELIVRLYVARNLAAVVRELHKAGHFVIDMKPKNMSVYRLANPGLIAMLDADGFCIYGGPSERYPAEMFTSEYIAPELLEGNRKAADAREEQDRWALAVIIFRLLNENVHPYSGSFTGAGNPTIDDNVRSWRYAYGRVPHPELRPNPLSLHEFFDDDTRELFDRAFGRDPYTRPDARTWRDHLHQFTDASTGRLLQCRTDPSHWHFSKGCGLCYREARLGAGRRGPQITVPPGLWKRPGPQPTAAPSRASTPRSTPPPLPSPTRPRQSTPPVPPPPRARSTLKVFARRALGILLTVVALAIGLSVLLQMALERTRLVTPASTPGPAGRTASAPSPSDSAPTRTPPANAPDRPMASSATSNASKPGTTSVSAERSATQPPSPSAATDGAAALPPALGGRSTPMSVPEGADRMTQEPSATPAADAATRAPLDPAETDTTPTPPKSVDGAAQSASSTSASDTVPRQADNDALLMECQGWVTKGRYALEDASYDFAVALAERALRLRANCPGAADLKAEAETAKQAARRKTR